MPRIRGIELQPNVSTSSPQRFASAEDFGGGVGRAVSYVGDVLQQIAGSEERILAEKRERDSMLWVSKSMAELRQSSLASFAEAQQTAPADGVGFTEARLAFFDQMVSQIAENAPTPIAAEELRIRALEARTGFLSDSISFEAKLGGQAARANYINITNSLAATVRANPAQFDGAIRDMELGVDALPVPDHVRVELKTDGAAMIATAQINAMIDADPNQAHAALLAGQWAGFISADKAETLIGNAEVEIRRREAEARQLQAEADARFQQRARYKIEDEIAAAADGKTTGLVDASDYRAVYGDEWERAVTNVAATRETAIAAQGLALTPLSQWLGVIDAAAPAAEGENFKAEASRHEALLTAANKLAVELDDDPAAYVFNHSPELQQAFAAAQDDPSRIGAAVDLSLRLQERMEVSPELRRPLPGDTAKSIVDRFAGAKPGEAVDLIQGYARDFGLHWPAVVSQLSAEGLPGFVKVLTVLDGPGDGSAANDLVEALKLSDAELRKQIPSQAATKIDDALETALDPLADTLPPVAMADVREAALRIALYNAAKGADPVAAATAAAQAFTGKYRFEGSYRIPNRFNPGFVDRGLRAALVALKPTDLRPVESLADPTLPVEHRQSEQLRILQSQPRWRTNEDDTGLYLLYPNGAPVQRADGSLVLYRFDDLAATGARIPVGAGLPIRGSVAP